MKIVAAAQVAAEAAVVVDSAAAQVVAAAEDTVGVEIAVTVAAEAAAGTVEAEIAAVTVVVIADVTAVTKSVSLRRMLSRGLPGSPSNSAQNTRGEIAIAVSPLCIWYVQNLSFLKYSTTNFGPH